MLEQRGQRHHRHRADAEVDAPGTGARNIWPFLIYGIVFLLLFIVATIPLGLGLLVVSPMIWASIYSGYRDIYLSK